MLDKDLVEVLQAVPVLGLAPTSVVTLILSQANTIRKDLRARGFTEIRVQMAEYGEVFEDLDDFPSGKTMDAWCEDLQSHGQVFMSVNVDKPDWTAYYVSRGPGYAEGSDGEFVYVSRTLPEGLAKIKKLAEDAKALYQQPRAPRPEKYLRITPKGPEEEPGVVEALENEGYRLVDTIEQEGFRTLLFQHIGRIEH